MEESPQLVSHCAWAIRPETLIKFIIIIIIKIAEKLVDYAHTTNFEFNVDPKVFNFHVWLIYSYLQIFKLIKCKWLASECADWFFDNIMTWSEN